jgi:predicted metal-dependent enzyme (double-stranded beta helix superfamily)
VPRTLLESAVVRVSATRIESLSDQERSEYLDAVQADIAAVDRAIAAQFFELHAQSQSQSQSQPA